MPTEEWGGAPSPPASPEGVQWCHWTQLNERAVGCFFNSFESCRGG